MQITDIAVPPFPIFLFRSLYDFKREDHPSPREVDRYFHFVQISTAFVPSVLTFSHPSVWKALVFIRNFLIHVFRTLLPLLWLFLGPNPTNFSMPFTPYQCSFDDINRGPIPSPLHRVFPTKAAFVSHHSGWRLLFLFVFPCFL